MKVLAIEDEKKIGSLIRKGLEAQGFVVDWVQNGNDGYVMATTRPYDVLVLDIMLPGRDGLSILRNLRERKVAVPVILLTARSELNERLEGLKLGADDYLTKPFFIEELIARIHAVSRRASGAVQSILSVADLTIRYNEPGGSVSLTLAAGDAVLVTISNTGPGIPAGDQPGIFERFYRGGRSASQAGDGLGLGLSLAREIVLAHHGHLRLVSSQPGRTCFEMSLDHAPAATDPASVSIQPAAPR